MSSISNPFRDALASKRPLLGIWSMLASTHVTEGLSYSGFDWILIDGEHAPISVTETIDHLRAVAGSSTVPIVRLPWNDPILIKRYLDIGATTLMLPYVQTAAEAANAVRAMRYPPAGRRGIASMHRASRWGRVRNYARDAEQGLFLIVQIETPDAVSNIDSIADIDGVDAVFFGPGDLAANMGHLAAPDHPEVTSAIASAMDRLRGRNVAVGVLAPNDKLAAHYIESGVDFISIANDTVILFKGADAIARRFGDMVGQAAPAARARA